MAYKIEIEKVINGLIIKVGCARFVAINTDYAMLELARYFKQPEEVEKEYRANFNMPNEVPCAQRTESDMEQGENRRSIGRVPERH